MILAQGRQTQRVHFAPELGRPVAVFLDSDLPSPRRRAARRREVHVLQVRVVEELGEDLLQ